MKILILSPYIYNEEFGHTKNKTGFGMMVMDIAKSLCEQGNEVCLLTHALCPRRTGGSIVIHKHTLAGVLIHAKIHGLSAQISNIHRLPCSLCTKLRRLFYYLDRGYVKKTIQSLKPDIVHIHGVGMGSKNYIEVCEELNVPFVVTAHGLIQNDIGTIQEHKDFEREFFRYSVKKGIPVTVVSSGIRQRLTGDYYGLNNTANIHVVTNGTDTHMMKTTDDIRSKYGIPANCKICIAVGSACKMKNQIQILRAFSLLPNQMRENTRVLILGNISEGYQIKKEISKLGLDNLAKCCGFVQHGALNNYYSVADLNILASKDEGFGLSIVEGFVYGVPCVVFSDLDAVQDVYDKNAIELCYNRTDESLAKAIAAGLEKQWDKEAIKQHCRKFSLQAMGEKYMNVYMQAIDGFKQ